MRVILLYGLLIGGGCERRLGDLCRWLLDNGDEAWILGTNISDIGRTCLFAHCGLPPERVLTMGESEYGPTGAFEEFVYEQVGELRPDIIDVQYVGLIPGPMNARLVYTSHGHTQPLPAEAGYSAVISVERLAPYAAERTFAPIYEEIWNWAPLERFPFQAKLGQGACFIGRSFKMINALKVAELWDGQIDAYGTVAAALPKNMPSNIRWLGFCDSATVMPRHRVVFGSAMVAMEAIAAGRLCIVGQEYDVEAGYIAEGKLAMPEDMEGMSLRQFAYRGQTPHVFEPTAPEVFADFRKALAHDFLKERKEMRGYIEAEHSKDGQCAKIRTVYEEVMGL